MARPFDFSWNTRTLARLRQAGLCACCGDELDDLCEHAHHVVPNQSGSAGDAGHRWLSEADNCVVLCEACHERVHEDGRYRSGSVAPAGYFVHSHGGNAPLHAAWAMDIERRTRAVFR